MDYWKNHQQTLSTEYQDLSFTKHTPLKASNFQSSSFLNQTNLNTHLRNSSIESINSPKKSRYLLIDKGFQNQLIRSHHSRSHFSLKDVNINDDIKRSAYLFFNQQKNKIQNTSKSGQYLLPKICVKSKKAYNSIKRQGSQNCEVKNSKEPAKPKLQKQSIFNKCKLNINALRKSLNEQNNVTNITEKFRLKCEAELDKLNFKIPQYFGREKCFFDLAQDEISQFYSNAQPQKQSQQPCAKQQKKRDKKEKRKFNLVRLDSEGNEQNKSVPSFLMERLSARDLFRSCNNSFLTDVPRIQNKVSQKPRLRHIV